MPSRDVFELELSYIERQPFWLRLRIIEGLTCLQVFLWM